MTTEQALAFLEAHQPLPDESTIGQTLLDQLREVIQHFEEHRDARCVLPLLLAMGTGTGCGLYETVQFIVLEYPAEVVIPALRQAMESRNSGTRTWGLHISGYFPDRSWLQYYRKSLRSADPFERSTGAAALSTIVAAEDVSLVQDALNHETEADVTEALQECLRKVTLTSGDLNGED